ncbi:MAG: hypothetical protein U5K32_08390 [Bacteroidales bacterium]|nr:hypothetical protein [Bacteroidales bacterium]
MRLAPFSTDTGRKILTYVDLLSTGRVVELTICQAGDGVCISVEGALSSAEESEVREKVGWMLGLEQDFTDFYAVAADEPKLAHVKERAQGRLLRSPSLFEDTVKTILTTNTSWGGTIRMVEGLVSEFGTPLPADPARRAFPTPEQVARGDEDDASCGCGPGAIGPPTCWSWLGRWLLVFWTWNR